MYLLCCRNLLRPKLRKSGIDILTKYSCQLSRNIKSNFGLIQAKISSLHQKKSEYLIVTRARMGIKFRRHEERNYRHYVLLQKMVWIRKMNSIFQYKHGHLRDIIHWKHKYQQLYHVKMLRWTRTDFVRHLHQVRSIDTANQNNYRSKAKEMLSTSEKKQTEPEKLPWNQ